MTLAQLENLFLSGGYYKVPSNLPEFCFFYRRENQGVNVIYVIDYKQGLYITEDQYAHLKDKIIDFFQEKGEREVHILSLVLSADIEKAKQLCMQDSFCWMIDTVSDRLLIYENQVPDFYGLKTLLENFLYRLTLLKEESFANREEVQGEAGQHANGTVGGKERYLPWVNIFLVAANVIIFLICTFTGDLLYNVGAFSVMDIISDGAYYRMFTSMFLHGNIQHLFSNMIVLYYVGEIVEKNMGHLPYAFIYVLSGVAGDVMSMLYEIWSGVYVSSIGASGAVFGIEGALLLLVILHQGKLERMTVGRVAFAIAFSLYCGYTGTNVNNAAHVGGVLMGFAIAGIWSLFAFYGRKKGKRDL